MSAGIEGVSDFVKNTLSPREFTVFHAIILPQIVVVLVTIVIFTLSKLIIFLRSEFSGSQLAAEALNQIVLFVFIPVVMGLLFGLAKISQTLEHKVASVVQYSFVLGGMVAFFLYFKFAI